MGGGWQKEEGQDLRLSRGEQLHNGNVHSGFGRVHVQSQAKKCQSGKASSFWRNEPVHSWMRCVMNMFLWTPKRCKVEEYEQMARAKESGEGKA